MTALAQFLFRQLYSTFAYFYDFVACVVSLGEWRAWGATVLPLIAADARVLELAHGTGHLYMTMRQRGIAACAIDLSPQMSRIAQQRLRAVHLSACLARADAQRLPFADASFDCVVATFPAPFIFADAMLAEARRVMGTAAEMLIVPSAQFTGKGARVKLLRVIYRLTGQGNLDAQQMQLIRQRFAARGFDLTEQYVALNHATVTIWRLARV